MLETKGMKISKDIQKNYFQISEKFGLAKGSLENEKKSYRSKEKAVNAFGIFSSCSSSFE
jgi:hypothetical protein